MANLWTRDGDLLVDENGVLYWSDECCCEGGTSPVCDDLVSAQFNLSGMPGITQISQTTWFPFNNTCDPADCQDPGNLNYTQLRMCPQAEGSYSGLAGVSNTVAESLIILHDVPECPPGDGPGAPLLFDVTAEFSARCASENPDGTKNVEAYFWIWWELNLNICTGDNVPDCTLNPNLPPNKYAWVYFTYNGILPLTNRVLMEPLGCRGVGEASSIPCYTCWGYSGALGDYCCPPDSTEVVIPDCELIMTFG